MSAAVIVRDASKQFSRTELPFGRLARLAIHTPRQPETAAVESISFSVHLGEIFGLVGLSGSGKTSLIRMLAGIILPDTGSVRVFGCDLFRQTGQVQRMTNRVSGEASFFKKLSALDNLLIGAQQYGLGGAEIRRQAQDLLAKLGLEEWAIRMPMDAMPRSLQQKVSIARALIGRPRLLLLDDPVRSLYVNEKRAVLQVIAEQSRAWAMTVVIAARDWMDVAHIADRIALLDRGRLTSIHTLHDALDQEGENERAVPVEDWSLSTANLPSDLIT